MVDAFDVLLELARKLDPPADRLVELDSEWATELVEAGLLEPTGETVDGLTIVQTVDDKQGAD